LCGAPEKIAAEAHPTARLVLYEDGLQTYLPNEDHHLDAARLFGDPRGAYRALKLRVRELRHPEDLALALMLPRHLARVAAGYLWITTMVPPAEYQRPLPWVHLQTSSLREACARVAPIVDDIGPEPGGPRALVLGQCFSNCGDLPRDVEPDC
jgi:hypothetical protein